VPTNPPLSFAVLIVAAGRGTRFLRSALIPQSCHNKVYWPLGSSTVLAQTLRPFLAHPYIAQIVCAIHADDTHLYEEAVASLSSPKLRPPVFGGATRQESVRRGLTALDPAITHVLVHDGARPFVSTALLDRLLNTAAHTRDALIVPTLLCTDTLLERTAEGFTPFDRGRVMTVQTPQLAPLPTLRARHAGEKDNTFTDDSSLWLHHGGAVETCEGDSHNVKITTYQDWEQAQASIDLFENSFLQKPRRSQATRMNFISKTSTGFDVHAFMEGDHVWLGGVRIPHTHGIRAHSDGDVLLHALTDALLGLLGDGDIGTHFPPSDAQWRNADSSLFVRFAMDRLKARGTILDHVSATILAEAPKLTPHRQAIIARLAELCGVSPMSIGLQATTTEGLGFVGRREGLCAQVTVTARFPVA
jgi:2-C-methyl-D-erythritol 4-phosphate cytidylyltransferase / 2-C-methyl-D-erythritol 2,4-cyclodiphosphate synthase